MTDERLEYLVQGHFDAELTAAEQTELQGLLQADQAARRHFARQCVVHGFIRCSRSRAMAPVASGGASTARIARARRRAQPASRRWWPLAAAAALLAAVAWWMIADGRQPPAIERTLGAMVEAPLRGQQLRRDAADLDLAAALPLRPGDTLLARSPLVLTYPAEPTRLALVAGSELVCLDEQGGKGFRLLHGALEAVVARQPAGAPLRILTAQGTTEVVGTAFRLEATAQATRLVVDQGTVRLAGAAGALLVHPGQEAALAADGNPRRVVDGNLLSDGGFEGDGRAWGKLRHSDGSWFVGRTIAASPGATGRGCAQLHTDPNLARGIFQDVAITGGADYAITLRMRRDDLPASAVAVTAHWLALTPAELLAQRGHPDFKPEFGFDTNLLGATELASHTFPIPPDAGWTEVGGRVRAPAEARGLRLHFAIPAGAQTGTASFDDAVIRRLGP